VSQPVWTLSVDLQTKTATFTTGLADAAKGARGSFNDIKEGAREMGRETSFSMMEARHGVMLLGEEFGVRLPRALTSFIASIGPIGAAMEAAFPFLAIAVGATLLLEHLAKLREKGDQLTTSQTNFGTAVANVLNGLNEKLLQAGIRADELNHNHLGALNKQLEMIDRQSMNELVQAFGVVAKASDVTMAQLKTSWYQFGAGSAGAKNALDDFKTKYDSLLAQGKDKEASDLLAGTRQSAERVLTLQKQIKDNQTTTGTHGTHNGDYNKFEEAKNALKREGIGYSAKEVEAQESLVGALEAQANVQSKVNELKAAQSSNAREGTAEKMGADADKAAREQAQQQKIAAEEAQKQWEANYRAAVAALEQSEKEKIDATKQGSTARLAAIDAAIKEEESKGLQENGFYRSLLTSRVEMTRKMLEELKKLQEEAGMQEASHEEKMGMLRVEAMKSADELRMSAHRVSDAERVAEEQKIAEAEFQVHQQYAQREIAALDESDKDYANKLKSMQDKQKEMVQAHENQITQIKNKAEEQRNARILSADQRMDDEMARGMSNVLMRHESFAKMMTSLGDQIAAGMIQTALKSILADDMTKEHDAAAAARKAYLAGMQFPFPANIVMGPALGAMAFASVMAFQEGGIVPGVGTGDIVPARLEPGEGVITKRVMEGLTNRAKFGDDNGSGSAVHVHHSPTYHINAIDGASVRGMLKEHSSTFENHFHSTLRKMNK
jgi:hypothetical protein